jgi:DNA-binding MarR family transcriptional regulator
VDVRLGVVGDKGRLGVIHLAVLTLRLMENWRTQAGGYDQAMILIAIVAISSERLTRGTMPEYLENLEQPFPNEHLAQCSISSIAAATGLNRETARRKVNDLVERGLLVRVRRGEVRFVDGLLQQEGALELVAAQLEAFRRTAESLMRAGVLTARKGQHRAGRASSPAPSAPTAGH